MISLMVQSGNQSYLAKKAYEIAYAVFRIVPKVLDGTLSQKMTAEATELLVGVAGENHHQALKSLEILNYLVKFGIDLNFISFMNGDVLIREISNFEASIAESINAANEDVDISGIFTVDAQEVRHSERREESSLPQKGSFAVASYSAEAISNTLSVSEDGLPKSLPKTVFPKPKTVFGRPSYSVTKGGETMAVKPGMTEKSGNIIKSGMRQIAILDRIRQSGNCRLRDIQEILPDCSERTIRYDLEDLIERNIIERTGNGGPSVSYRIRQMAA